MLKRLIIYNLLLKVQLHVEMKKKLTNTFKLTHRNAENTNKILGKTVPHHMHHLHPFSIYDPINGKFYDFTTLITRISAVYWRMKKKIQ
jgi:hypothetical protein